MRNLKLIHIPLWFQVGSEISTLSSLLRVQEYPGKSSDGGWEMGRLCLLLGSESRLGNKGLYYGAGPVALGPNILRFCDVDTAFDM